MQFFKHWRQRRKEAAAEKARIERLFDGFLAESRPLAPRARKHQEAAVYRHAWKRSAVLEVLYQREMDDKKVLLFRAFQQLAADRYYRMAPVNAYGTVRLKIESEAAERLLEAEAKRLSPQPAKKPPPTACIYLGRCEEGRVYIGQTIEVPERRWVQHRVEGTGPFKDGAQFPHWEVLEGNIPKGHLDERESYYIGLLDTFQNGYNETRGNDWDAYERGRIDARTST